LLVVETAVSFGYKSIWLAVGGCSADVVADTLRLRRRRPTSWSEGVKVAYDDGVLLTPAVSGWLFVVAARASVLLDPSTVGFPDWLARLSEQWGLVQYFATHRVVETHAWARADHGIVERAYCYLGESGRVCVDVGERTPEEVELGIGAPAEDEDGWLDDIPDEDDVLALAGRWSANPGELDGLVVPGRCLVGYP
jgi:hypothetical protein